MFSIGYEFSPITSVIGKVTAVGIDSGILKKWIEQIDVYEAA